MAFQRVALITAGTAGLGAEVARKLAPDFRVVSDRRYTSEQWNGLNADTVQIVNYANNSDRAKKLLEELRKSRPQVIDTKLHISCKGLAHRCMAPVPELFHHHRVTGQARIGEPGAAPSGRETLNWWRTSHKYTYNVEWSARCNALQSGDQVGNKWQCLPGESDDHV